MSNVCLQPATGQSCYHTTLDLVRDFNEKHFGDDKVLETIPIQFHYHVDHNKISKKYDLEIGALLKAEDKILLLRHCMEVFAERVPTNRCVIRLFCRSNTCKGQLIREWNDPRNTGVEHLTAVLKICEIVIAHESVLNP